MRFLTLSLGVLSLLLAACGGASDTAVPTEGETPTVISPAVTTPNEGEIIEAGPRLEAILAAQFDETKARYPYRHPRETIEFFGITPGMTVAELLPGGGWYSKILLPYLGDKGRLIGVDYSVEMWSKFGGFADEAFLEAKKTWPETFVVEAVEKNWQANTMGGISAFAFGSRDTSLDGTVDVVFAARALHHLNRFNTEEKDYMSEALADVYALLKPGGVFAVVQHRAPEERSAEWANGDNGYLKESDVIVWVEAAGFKLVGDSDVNANPKDVPTESDAVWRLPPSLGNSRDDPDLQAQLQAIGESDRMTLKFIKP